MNRSYILCAVAITAPLIVRTLVFKGRRLHDPEYILAELRRLPCPVVDDDSEMWSMDRDSEFWKDIQGMRGLWRMRRKSLHLKDFVGSLNLSPADLDELEFISHRCYWISALILLQFMLRSSSTGVK